MHKSHAVFSVFIITQNATYHSTCLKCSTGLIYCQPACSSTETAVGVVYSVAAAAADTVGLVLFYL